MTIKANLLPERAVPSALHSSNKAHLYPHNEAAEHRAAGKRGNGGEENVGGETTDWK